jgi:hypothetical protein
MMITGMILIQVHCTKRRDTLHCHEFLYHGPVTAVRVRMRRLGLPPVTHSSRLTRSRGFKFRWMRPLEVESLKPSSPLIMMLE